MNEPTAFTTTVDLHHDLRREKKFGRKPVINGPSASSLHGVEDVVCYEMIMIRSGAQSFGGGRRKSFVKFDIGFEG